MLTELDTFLRVVEAGSLSAAARQLKVPTSTVSRAVGRLEKDFRSALMFRGAGGLTLTEAGRTLVAQAGPHLLSLREVQARFAEGDSQLRGELRLTATASLGEDFLVELVTRFGARHPLLRIEVDLSARLVNLVREGFDVALRAGARLPDDEGLVARKVSSTEVQLFAAPAYLAQRGTPLAPPALAEHECVLFQLARKGSRWELEAGGPVQHQDVNGRLASNDLTFVRAALRAGAGIGPLPDYFAAEDLRAGRLVRVLPGWRRHAGGLFVVYPAARHLPRKVAAFRDFVAQLFRERAKP